MSKKSQLLLKLLRAWTRAEIMARVGPFGYPHYVDYAMKEVELRKRIRKLLYGSDNLVELGLKWGMLKPRNRGKKNDSKR